MMISKISTKVCGYVLVVSSRKQKNSKSRRKPRKWQLFPHRCTLFLAGQRAAAPLWPGVCPVPQGEGAVIGLCHADVALGSALDSTGALWYPRPKGANTHRSLTGGSDRLLRGRIYPSTNSELPMQHGIVRDTKRGMTEVMPLFNLIKDPVLRCPG